MSSLALVLLLLVLGTLILQIKPALRSLWYVGGGSLSVRQQAACLHWSGDAFKMGFTAEVQCKQHKVCRSV
ncbi:MAG: hypothetical protein ACLTXH_02160 [Enterobacter hormaechei]